MAKNENANANQKLTKKENIIQAVKFGLFSISAGVIEFISYTILFSGLHTKEWIAQFISLVLSVIWNFTVNRKFTFKSANNIPVAMLKVAVFYCVFTPLSGWFTSFATETLVWNAFLVKAICMLTNFVAEYFYCRYVVFRNSMNTNDIAEKGKEKKKAKAELNK